MGPSELNFEDVLEIALEAATKAGALLRGRFGGPARGVGTKSSATDLVSDADRDAERLILDVIAAHRPDDALLAEEGGGRSEGGVTWVVDPLDGTVNYLYGIPVWCVSIGVLDHGSPVAAVIHDPNRNESYTALRGAGAALDGAPLRVSEQTDLSQALVGTGFAYDPRTRAAQARVVERVLPSVRDIRRTGSAALDLAAVACGRIDAFYESHMEPWDKAAGVLIVEEAGGRLLRLAHPLLPPPDEAANLIETSHGLIAGNASLCDELSHLVDIGG